MAKQTALRLIPEMTDHTDDKERPTDRVHAAPDLPIDFVAPAFPPSAAVPRLHDRPDPNSWEHQQLKTLVEGVEEIKAGRKQQGDIASLLSQHTAEIKQRLDESDRRNQANYSLVLDQFRGLTTRVSHIETSAETSSERIQRMELDMAALRHQVDRMDAELQAMKPPQLP